MLTHWVIIATFTTFELTNNADLDSIGVFLTSKAFSS